MVRIGGRSRRTNEDDLETERVSGNFFACYLLCSTSPRFKGQTYIGFTTNPRRRIRQHNGELTSGAIRTKRKRPWEMVLCIHGFPTNVSALQFEWAWQHPKESLAVRKSAATMKSLSGVANKVKIAYTMLTLPSWDHLNLTVNYFSSNNVKYVVGCPSLPSHMRLTVLAMDQLPCYNHSDNNGEDRWEFAMQQSSENSITSDTHQVSTNFVELAMDDQLPCYNHSDNNGEDRCEFAMQQLSETSITSDTHQESTNFVELAMDDQFPYHHYYDDQDEFAIQPSSEAWTINVQEVSNFTEFSMDDQFPCYHHHHHGGSELAKKPLKVLEKNTQVIDLITPPNCKLGRCLIDLTKSPIPIIQL